MSINTPQEKSPPAQRVLWSGGYLCVREKKKAGTVPTRQQSLHGDAKCFGRPVCIYTHNRPPENGGVGEVVVVAEVQALFSVTDIEYVVVVCGGHGQKIFQCHNRSLPCVNADCEVEIFLHKQSRGLLPELILERSRKGTELPLIVRRKYRKKKEKSIRN